MRTLQVNVGKNLKIGGDAPVVVQTMCNTHTTDVEASLRQCRQMVACGAQMIRLTVPTLKDVEALASIRQQLRSEGIDTPLVADVHFSSEVAIAAAAVVEKVRINPGNFHADHANGVRRLMSRVDVKRIEFSTDCEENEYSDEGKREHDVAHIAYVSARHAEVGERDDDRGGDGADESVFFDLVTLGRDARTEHAPRHGE